MDMQKHLLYLTNMTISEMNSLKIRGVVAEWSEEENTAKMTFYFDGEISEDEREDAAIACTEIIAHFYDSLLEENFLRLDYPKPLPERFLAYKRKEEVA